MSDTERVWDWLWEEKERRGLKNHPCVDAIDVEVLAERIEELEAERDEAQRICFHHLELRKKVEAQLQEAREALEWIGNHAPLTTTEARMVERAQQALAGGE